MNPSSIHNPINQQAQHNFSVHPGPSASANNNTPLQENAHDAFLQPKPQATNNSVFKTALFGGNMTILELVIPALYPLALLLGGLIQIVGGASPSYFSNKRNIINVMLVKQGWFWVTLITGYHAYTIYSRKSVQNTIALRNLVIRYVLATAWWIFFAQWFFGSPLMDKVFVLTGGGCANVDTDKHSFAINSSATCKSVGGRWSGGYDPSGHTFLLAHASLYIWIEILPYIHKYFKIRSINSANTNKEDSVSRAPAISVLESLFFKLSMAFLAVYWWMLLMTGIYFHSFIERFTGMLWGYIGVVFIYALANGLCVPALQNYLVVIPV